MTAGIRPGRRPRIGDRHPRVYVVPVLLAVLFLQFGLAQHSEPYPAVIMPSFEGVRHTDGLIQVRQYRITATAANGDEFVDQGARRLLGGLPDQYRPPTIEFLMSDGETGGHDAFAAMQARNRARAEQHLPAFKEWLRARLQLVTGRDDWEAVVFERLEPRYDPDTGRFVDTELATGRWAVALP
jgi:hypothetical protein